MQLPASIKKLLKVSALTVMAFAPVAASLLINVPQAQATAAGNTYIRCDRMKAATAPGSCLVVITTSTAATAFTEGYVKVTLGSQWVSGTNFSTTPANYTVSTTGLPAGVTGMLSVATADQVTGQTIRFPVGNLAASTTYGFYITGTGLIANPAASNAIIDSVFTRDATDTTTGDTKDVAVPVISDDQISITASVAPTFNFVFSNNSQNLNLSTGAITSGIGTAVTVTTNAPGGWNAWVKSANVGLTSANASKTIATVGTVNDSAVTTLTAGTEGYVLNGVLTTDAVGGDTVTINPDYAGGANSGGTLSTTFQPIASATGGTANGDVITLVPKVAISGTTAAAADYTDTLTVVGAGTF